MLPDQKLASELTALAASTSGSRVRVTGGSMLPLLRPGMVVDIAGAPVAPRIGELLVFRNHKGLIVHRVVRRRGASGVMTCGDACPENPEWTSFDAVVGRARAVWSDERVDARRIDGFAFRIAGWLLARTRPLRATAVLFARAIALALRKPEPVPAFRALFGAAIAFERGDLALGLARLNAVPAAPLAEVARRHGMGGLVQRWLASAAAAGLAVPPEMLAIFQRLRWFAALSTAQVAERASDVSRIFADRGIPAVLLKGAGRLCAGEADADVNASSDVDVLVPAASADAAVAALRAAGFREHLDAAEIRFHERYEHHRAALWAASGTAPVEVHVRLCMPGSVSATLDYAALAAHVRETDGPYGRVRVFDDVAAALHLAYHARDFLALRDIVLLGRLLRRMNAAERAAFDAFVARETRDAVRLAAAVTAARALAGPVRPSRDVAAYLSWAVAREDVPAALRKRAAIVEALRARCLPHYRGLPYTLDQLHRWAYNLAGTPLVLRWTARGARDGAAAFLGAASSAHEAELPELV